MTGLSSDNLYQLDLFEEHHNDRSTEPLMQVFDSINDKYGRGTIKLACAGKGGLSKKESGEDAPWLVKRDYLSPHYTTNIAESPIVY